MAHRGPAHTSGDLIYGRDLLRPTVTTEPATEPITIHEAKAHVNIASTDTAHDALLYTYMQAARQQWERDTQEHFISRSVRVRLPYFYEVEFSHRPVTAISSITYYDTGNSSQTLSTNIYELDADEGMLRLKYLQTFPATCDRWDAVTINYTLGSHSNSTTVPPVAKQAMLLLVGYYFDKNRGDNDGQYDMRAYESLVHKYMRSTYP